MNTIQRIKSKTIKKHSIIYWLVLYLVLTVLLYFFGPINWQTQNTECVVVLLTLYILFFFLGYKASERRVILKGSLNYKDFSNTSSSKVKFVLPLVILGILFDLLMVVRVANTLSISEIIGKMINGLVSPSIQYSNFYNEASQNNLWGGSLFSLLVTLGSPLCIAGIILSVYYFPKLKFRVKVLAVLLIILHLGCKLISSANEGIFDLTLYICVPIFLRFVNSRVGSPKKAFTIRINRIVIVLFVIVLFVLAYSYFSVNIIGRTKANFAFATLGDNTYNSENWLAKVLPEHLYAPFVYFCVYLTEGYYGFSVATTIDWVPMFGSGFSSFIYNNIQEIFGVDLFQFTYQTRVQNVANWGALKNFHTAYTFWANDVGFIGVILVMFLIGYFLFKVYKKSIIEIDNSCIVLMPLLLTLVFYLPANNKVLIQPASFLLILYILVYKYILKPLFLKK